MDLTLTPEQESIVSSVRTVLTRTSVNAKAPSALADEALHALAAAGFLDVMRSGGTALDATLVIDEVAAAGTTAPVGARVLVGPLVTDDELPVIVGLADTATDAVVRFGDEADAFLVLNGAAAVLATRTDARIESSGLRWGYPAARVTITGGEALADGSREALQRAWRIALAAEAGGLMRAAVRQATDYVRGRTQFGRSIGTYQSVQHRLARAFVLAEGTKWLARRAAWSSHDDALAAAAACYACEAMRDTFRTVHQVTGAMGLTDEFELTRFTGKLAVLHTELGGAAEHARALAHNRWFAPTRVHTAAEDASLA